MGEHFENGSATPRSIKRSFCRLPKRQFDTVPSEIPTASFVEGAAGVGEPFARNFQQVSTVSTSEHYSSEQEIMTCEELQDSLSAYVDDELTPPMRAACDGHFAICPVCRAELADMKLLARRFATVARPAPPADLASAINNRLHTERAVLVQAQVQHRNVTPLWSPASVLGWIAPRAMPFSVGAFASVILFVAVLGALLPAMRSLHMIEQISFLELAASDEGGYDVTQPITAADYVASRTPFTVVSPSLDPRGALATATTPASEEDEMDEDDMLLVADVYSDGQASVAEVVTPPRDARMLSDLEAAFRRNPAFVPARLDHRPPTMRVVFMVQRMNVRDTVY